VERYNSIKIIPFYKIGSLYPFLNLHSRSKANPYVYKKYSKEENNEKQVNRTRNDFNLAKILVI